MSGCAARALRRFDERFATQEAGARIEAHRLLELVGQRLEVALLRRDTQAHGGFAFELEAFEAEFQRLRAAVGLQRHHAQCMTGPATLRRSDERALEGRVAAGVEHVHERLAEQVARIRVPEEFAPGRIDVDDDAFLHVRDRVGRARHERAHLVAVLTGGGERAVQCIVEPCGVEFARGDGLQPAAGSQRHDVGGTELEATNEVGFGERIAHHEGRHTRSETRTLLHRAVEFVRVGDAEEQQLWRIGRAERVREVAELPHPRAVNRLARVAQGAVDDLDGVLLPRQDDHWNGADFAQFPTPLGTDRAGRAPAHV